MPAARELTLAPNELIHPERIGNSLTWIPGRGLDELADDLRMFDPRLTLAYHGQQKRWELWRFEGGKYNLVCRSRPGLPFPKGLLEELQMRDSRRGYDPAAEVQAHNDAIDREKDRQHDELTHEVASRVAWSIKKDIGHKYA